jgi:DNA-binding NtrC family response regulator
VQFQLAGKCPGAGKFRRTAGGDKGERNDYALRPPGKIFEQKGANAPDPMILLHNGIDLNSAMEKLENRFIMQAPEKSGGNKKVAAALLYLKRTTFIEK